MADWRARFGRIGLTAVALAFAIGALVEDVASPTVTIDGHHYDRGAEPVIVAVLCGVVALVALRSRLGLVGPLAAVGLLGIGSFGAHVWVLDSALVFVLAMLACGLSGYLAVSRVQQAGLLVLWAVVSTAAWQRPHHGWGQWISAVVFTSIAWLVGAMIRRPVARAHSAEERAVLLEQDQTAAAWQAVIDERRRIARELHDIIAHSVSVMTVQTGAVRRLLTPDQTRERSSLLAVERTGREALGEMRRLVGLLKEDDVQADYAPQPGMQTLDSLITTVREAGLPVDLDVQGDRRPLPPGVDLTAFRVVQEALTNALKHAGPAQAWVRVCWSDAELRIEVTNDGHVISALGNGYGNAGMRERLRIYGGRLESGPRPDGGYAVRAYLPLESGT